jgi:hypothetical protein
MLKSPDIRISPGWPDALIAAIAAMIVAAGAERAGRQIHTYADMVAPEGG